jgi:hypothetical protein
VGRSEGRFFTTKWEYDVAKKYGLIEDDRIVGVVDCDRFSDFASFIVPNYEKRMDGKKEMQRLKDLGLEDSFDFEELHKWDLFRKYLLNNSYGKNAQNPRNFKEYYYTDAGQRPPDDWMQSVNEADDDTRHKYGMPIERAEDFEIWAKPSPGRRFNNVGTAASITGAARAKLLEALQFADDPIYCDTDSIICRHLENADVNVSKLGAWKLEAEFDRVIIAGRKLYACEVRGYPDGHEKRIKIRSKGATGLVWTDFEKLLDAQIIETINKAPTISKTGEQQYMRRRIRATAPEKRKSLHGTARNIPASARGTP